MTRWRPTGPLALVEERVGDHVLLWAVPISAGPGSVPGGANVQLAEITGMAQGWSVAPDGSVFVFALASRDGAGSETRLALWDAANGTLRWLTPLDDPGPVDGTNLSFPTFSADSREVFFVRARYAQGVGSSDLGIWRIGTDGTGLAQVRPPAAGMLGTHLHGVTPDGRGLVWGRQGLEGATVVVLDRSTRAERELGCCLARIEAWRDERPRALVTRHGGDVSSASLILWDDLAPSSERLLYGPNAIVWGADWDPRSEGVVAAVGAEFGKQQLVIFNQAGIALETLSQTIGAARPRWEPEGIVYEQWLPRDSGARRLVTEPREIRVIDSGGGDPQTLLSGRGSVRLVAVVRP
jgi:hypothetical protein